MKLVNDFFNKLVGELDKKYFPNVKYYMDDHNCAKIHHTCENFSNGVMMYRKLIKVLSENCCESQEVIHQIVSKYVEDFEGCKFTVRTIDKILTPRSCKFGAPMGRAGIDNRETEMVNGTLMAKFNGKVFDCAVPMSSCGAYSVDGTYWGIGKQLRVEYTKDLSYVRFYRKGEK